MFPNVFLTDNFATTNATLFAAAINYYKSNWEGGDQILFNQCEGELRGKVSLYHLYLILKCVPVGQGWTGPTLCTPGYV